MKYIILILITVMCLCPITLAQVGGISASAFPRQVTVAQLPVASSGNHGMRIVTDGANDSDCTVGGSTFIVVCLDTGSIWSALGSGSGSGVTDHGLLTGLNDDDHTQYHNDSRAATWLLLQSIAWSQLTGIPDLATQVELDTHEGNANIHHTPTVDTDDQIASEVEYDNTTSGLTSIEVQSAIDEIVSTPGGSGDVVGPASAIDNTIARFDSTTGKLIQGSSVDVDDSGNLTVPGAITVSSSGVRNVSASGTRFDFSGSFEARILAQNTVRLQANTTGVTVSELTISGDLVNSHFTQTCTDSGDANPGFLAITVSARSNVEVTQADVSGGCTASLSESGATRGQVLVVSNVSNAGGTLDFADSAGVQETNTGCSLGLYGIATFRYIVDRWILQSCVPVN